MQAKLFGHLDAQAEHTPRLPAAIAMTFECRQDFRGQTPHAVGPLKAAPDDVRYDNAIAVRTMPRHAATLPGHVFAVADPAERHYGFLVPRVFHLRARQQAQFVVGHKRLLLFF
jgi:hypothetical protein